MVEITTLHRQVDWLTQQLCLMRRQRFGASSEQTKALVDTEQYSLFNEAEVEAKENVPEPKWEEIAYRRKKQMGKRELDLSEFPVEQVVHALPESQQVCTLCGGSLHACGHDVLRRELSYVPAQYKVVEHVQTVYSCRHCEKSSEYVPMRKSEVPAPLIPGSGLASPSLLAHIMNNKYVLALPLYRQEQEMKRIGLPISRQTMANWMIYTHRNYLKAFCALLHQELLGNEILHADETTVSVLREDGCQARQKSYLWVYRTSGDTDRPVVLYDYQPSRAGVCASNFLKGLSGLLHTDGYEAYHCKLPSEITAVGCWAHMRRKFSDALKVLPPDIRECSPAQTGLAFCNKLFHLEEHYAKLGLSFQERYDARREKSKRTADAFFIWAKAEQEKNPVPKSVFGAALTYALHQQE